jgi:hypothetical protein
MDEVPDKKLGIAVLFPDYRLNFFHPRIDVDGEYVTVLFNALVGKLMCKVFIQAKLGAVS